MTVWFPSGIVTNLLLWPSGSEAVLGLGGLQFAAEHLRVPCEMLDQSRSLDMLLALHLLAAASLSLSLSQTCVRWVSDSQDSCSSGMRCPLSKAFILSRCRDR
jgi:hypothetical protein